MASHNKERYLQFKSSTQIYDDGYLVLEKRNKPKSNIQEQVHNREKMEAEHRMAKKIVLNDKAHEKLDYNKCLKISEVEPLLLH